MAESESNSGSSPRPLMSCPCPNGLEYDQVMVLKVPLKSCIKQSNGLLLGSSLQEPLLAEEFKGMHHDESSNKAECEDEEFKLADGENHAGEEEEEEELEAGNDEDDDDKINGRRRVRWVDGDGKDIAEVREFEDSDRDEDGCMQGGECRCVIQ